MADEDTKFPKSPKRVAIEAALAVIAFGGIIGAIILAVIGGDSPAGNHEANFMKGIWLGAALAPFAITAAVIAYTRQAKKLTNPT